MTTSDLPNVGDVVAGKYRIERLLARGGMGAVFEAYHELLQQRVALKVMLREYTDSDRGVTRFLNEARAASRIEGEHVARVLDLGQLEDGSPFIALELLSGSDLQDVLISRGQLPVAEAVDYVLQALEAIAQAHALGIVHRDLKPGNLFLASTRSGAQVVKVLDFGISKFVKPIEGMQANELATSASLLGSPAYIAPERLRGGKTIDARADVWALGVILFELLTERLPFRGQTVADMFLAVLKQKPRSLHGLRSDVPPGLEQVVLRCLAKDPKERLGDVGELAEALAPFAPAHALESVVRVKRALVAPPPPPSRGKLTEPTGLPWLGPSTASTQNHAQWTTSTATTGALPSKRLVVLMGIGLVALVVFIRAGVALRATDRLHEAAPPQSAAATPIQTQPAPSAPRAEPTAPMPLPAMPAASLATMPALSVSAPTATNAPRRTAPAHHPSRPPAAAPTCRIASWYDSDGQPHFKKVCDAEP